MKPYLIVLLCFSMFLSGCAGREANPIPVYMPGDENRSCEALKAEIAQLQVDMARVLPKTDILQVGTQVQGSDENLGIW